MTEVAADPAVRTTCPYCGVGCGILARARPDRSVRIEGDPDHPANHGRLCSKGTALGETLGLEGRLLRPEIGGRPANWDEALDLVAARFRETIDEHGPGSVAIYGSGQLLTEDYYVANKLMKGFVGSANIDTNSRLCMASSVAGHKRAFGSDTVPGCYEDLEQADLVVLVGTNLAWCHPVLFQRISQAKALRPEMRVVLIDPRRTATAELADLHLPVRADGDSALFVGLLSYLAAEGAGAEPFVSAHTTGIEAALDEAEGWSIERVSDATGADIDDLERFYNWFYRTERVVTVYSQGVNQSGSGTDKVNAIINCHLVTGRIGRPGMGPFSVTGQPNAMGGREVGGLANMLAAHMDFAPDAIDRLRRFWGSEQVATKPGLRAVDMFAALGKGEIKAIWIMGTNPVVSMPDADAVKAALAACPFVVVSDMTAETDTAALAHVLLPAAPWGEKDGTVTNSERRISRQRAFQPLAGEARPDWWIVSQVAQRMGYGEAFAYRGPAEIFAEHVALSAFENAGSRDFDLGGLAGAVYDDLSPVQWPVREQGGAARLLGDGRFFTPDGKARFIAVTPPPPIHNRPGELVLNTGRVRDHWHTMTRTGKAARLSGHYAEPFVEMHPDDARRLGIKAGGLVRLSSRRGEVTVRALVTRRQQPGSVFAPMHWTDQFASAARIDALVPAKVDPLSAQPALKMGHIHAEPAAMATYGFFVAPERPRLDASYWAVARANGGFRGELAWTAEPHDWIEWLGERFAIPAGDWVTFGDARSGRRSFAALREGRLVAALYVSPDPVLVARQWAVDLLGREHLDAATVLAGRPRADIPDAGPLVCACHGVGRNEIVRAISEQGCGTVAAIGEATRAGTNCGACRVELGMLLKSHLSLTEAAERAA